MKVSRIARAMALALCVSQATATAVAQTPDDFTRGLAALAAGEHADAAAAFELAYTQTRRPLALVNLGIAYTQLGRIDEAIAALTRYVEVANPVTDAKNISAVRAEIERLTAMRPPRSAAEPPAPPPSAAPMPTPVGEPALRETPVPDDAAPDDACSLGQVCLGPVLALGLPNLVGGALEIRIGDYVGAGIGFQMLPNVPILDLGSLRATLFTAQARVYPFGGALFATAGFAYQSATATAETAGITAEGSAGIPAFVFGLGLFGRHGAVLGIDIGVLIPLGNTSASVETLSSPPMGVDPKEVAEVQANARRSAHDFVDYLPALVQLNALRIGYLF